VGISSFAGATDTFEICVRKAGRLTSALHQKKEGDLIGVRGPLGKGYFPMKEAKGKNLLLIAGGIGIIPLRAVILDILENPKSVSKAQLLYGAKCETEFLYKDELKDWQKIWSMSLTVDKHGPEKCSLVCDEGLITHLLEKEKIVPDPLVFIVGPPVMCKFVIGALKKKGVKDDGVYICLERNMQCGVGECHHCGIGNKLVCKDGPVFKYSEIKGTPAAV